MLLSSSRVHSRFLVSSFLLLLSLFVVVLALHQRAVAFGKMSLAKVYANVNTQRPKEYWDYESLAITWGCVLPLPVYCLAPVVSLLGLGLVRQLRGGFRGRCFFFLFSHLGVFHCVLTYLHGASCLAALTS